MGTYVKKMTVDGKGSRKGPPQDDCWYFLYIIWVFCNVLTYINHILVMLKDDVDEFNLLTVYYLYIEENNNWVLETVWHIWICSTCLTYLNLFHIFKKQSSVICQGVNLSVCYQLTMLWFRQVILVKIASICQLYCVGRLYPFQYKSVIFVTFSPGITDVMNPIYPVIE